MERLFDLTVAEQQIEMRQHDRLGLHQRLVVGRIRLVGARQELHEQEDQQMDGLLVCFLHFQDAMKTRGQIGIVHGTGAGAQRMEVAVFWWGGICVLFVVKTRSNVKR